ncbi:hypothetical protein LCGC14_0147060 [marine sediment metagenome]|uniref:Uncharacterized protein n=1 Tax=marine sediment metagenome TaxID=412755 RepID=A0A0F9V3L7_9ZZZZ
MYVDISSLESFTEEIPFLDAAHPIRVRPEFYFTYHKIPGKDAGKLQCVTFVVIVSAINTSNQIVRLEIIVRSDIPRTEKSDTSDARVEALRVCDEVKDSLSKHNDFVIREGAYFISLIDVYNKRDFTEP